MPFGFDLKGAAKNVGGAVVASGKAALMKQLAESGFMEKIFNTFSNKATGLLSGDGLKKAVTEVGNELKEQKAMTQSEVEEKVESVMKDAKKECEEAGKVVKEDDDIQIGLDTFKELMMRD